MSYKDKQKEIQSQLLGRSETFGTDKGNGTFMGQEYPFVLKNGDNNLYQPILQEVKNYFKDNNISWWGGGKPTGHILSSQMACLNHLFSLRTDKAAVLAMLNGVKNEFAEVLPICVDKQPEYIGFEITSDKDHLNEGQVSRGANCTSIDALIYARHRNGSLWLIPIEWKYTESYSPTDKSNEDRDGEPKGSNGKGLERLRRYSGLIDESKYLTSLPTYQGSAYFFEPFYQLMRQTLWAEQMVQHKATERLKADDFLHIHVVPAENDDLLHKNYSFSGKGMDATWNELLTDPTKHLTISPQQFLAPLADLENYVQLTSYLKARYWQI